MKINNLIKFLPKNNLAFNLTKIITKNFVFDTNKSYSLKSYKQNIARGIFTRVYEDYKKPVIGKSNKKERKRHAKRERLKNKADPMLTNEPPILSWDEKKGKVLYKFLNEWIKLNRFTREKRFKDQYELDNKENNKSKDESKKTLLKDEESLKYIYPDKEEYIKKTKEINLYYANIHRKESEYEENMKDMRKQIDDSAALLSSTYRDELIINGVIYTSMDAPNDAIPNNEIYKRRLPYMTEFLLQEQKLRLVPEEVRVVDKAVLSSLKEDSTDYSVDPISDDYYELSQKLVS